MKIEISEGESFEMLEYAADVIEWLHDRLKADSEAKWSQVYRSNDIGKIGSMSFSATGESILEYREKLINAAHDILVEKETTEK